jgi:hypothetical protein
MQYGKIQQSLRFSLSLERFIAAALPKPRPHIAAIRVEKDSHAPITLFRSDVFYSVVGTRHFLER